MSSAYGADGAQAQEKEEGDGVTFRPVTVHQGYTRPEVGYFGIWRIKSTARR